MKAFLILFISSFFIFDSHSQVFVKGININLEPVQYCSVRLGGSIFMNGYHASVDYGQQPQTSRNRMLTTKTGEKIVLNSKMHLLNFMESNGWNFIEVLEDTDEDETYFTYVFRKSAITVSQLQVDEWDCIPEL